MLNLENIKIQFKCQGFEALNYDEEDNKSILVLRSTVATSSVCCPKCLKTGKSHIYDDFCITLKDMPIVPDKEFSMVFLAYRYRCQ